MQSAKRDSESENSSSDGAADGDDGDWEELQDNEMEEVRAFACLLDCGAASLGSSTIHSCRQFSESRRSLPLWRLVHALPYAALRLLQATSCLFTSRTHPSPAAALAHAKDLGFDFAALKQACGCCGICACPRPASMRDVLCPSQELGLDFYGCIKAINFVRRKVRCAACSQPSRGCPRT